MKVVKRRDLLTVTVDRHKSASMAVPKRLNVGRHFTIGGWHHHEDSRAKHVSKNKHCLIFDNLT